MARILKLPAVAHCAVATAVLIFLSGTASGLECYWCGPLAEQVHRSQRAPPCDLPQNHSTVCEPGFTHCATVATSPPFIESRYCVKFYQDECYTLYCNSSKTFRTTCPCTGELCNGLNTPREIEAFAALQQSIGKTQNARIHKRDTSPELNETESDAKESKSIDGFNKTGTNSSSNMIENELDDSNSNEISNDNVQTDQLVEKIDNKYNTTPGQVTNIPQNKEDPKEEHTGTTPTPIKETTTSHVEQNNIVDVSTTVVTKSQTVNETSDNDATPGKQMPTIEALEQISETATSSEKTTEQNKIVDESTTLATLSQTVKEPSDNDAKLGKQLPTAEALQQDSEATTSSEKPTEQNKIVDETTTVAAMSQTVKQPSENDAKPRKQLPTAEALQQNSETSSSEKTTESTNEPTLASTKESITLMPTKDPNNKAIGLSLSASIILLCLLVNYT